MHRHQGGGQIRGRHVDRPPHRVLVDLGGQLALQIGGTRIRVLQHRMHQAAELGSHRQIRHRRGHVGSGRGGAQRDVGDLVVEFDDLGFAAHPGALLGGPYQARVGGSPPGGVDTAMEVSHREFLRTGLDGEVGARRDLGLLDRQRADVLPSPQ